MPSKKATDGSEAVVQALRSGLQELGDVNLVDDLEHSELVDTLGEGGFGVAELRRVPGNEDRSAGASPHFFVVKRVRLRTVREWQVKHLLQEVRNGAAMRHPHIVCTYGAYLAERSRSFCLVIEYAPGGALDNFIIFHRSRGYLSEEDVTAWLSQLCSAVSYMHDRRVLHRDISSGNIFMNFDGDLVLGDLGLSREMGAQTKAVTQLGTPQYMSPERISGKPYGKACDLWAIGVVLYEMMALYRPFDDGNLATVVMQIANCEPNKKAQSQFAECPFSAQLKTWASAEGLLNPEPSERTPIAAILESYPLPTPPEGPPEQAEGASASVDPFLSSPDGPLCPASLRRRTEEPAHKHVPKQRQAARANARRPWEGLAGTSPPRSDESIPAEGSAPRARIPLECPTLPAAFEPRHDLTDELRQHLLRPLDLSSPAATKTQGLTAAATVIFGMGGTGKSLIASSIVRDVQVASSFDRICWIPIGQTPEVRRLLRLLHAQLQGIDEGSTVEGELVGLDLAALTQRVATVASGCSRALVVFDDVWDPTLVRQLAEPLGPCGLLVTTRVHHLLPPPAMHVHCGLLSPDDALRLLMRCGSIRVPPGEEVSPAAVKIVDLCGRLPLAIAIAGAMVQERADDWETVLVPLLRGGNKAALRARSLEHGDSDASDSDEGDEERLGSVEDRVIGASLTLLRSTKQHRAVTLFHMLAAFPEDATVPGTVFDTLDPVFNQMLALDRATRKGDRASTATLFDAGLPAEGGKAGGAQARRYLKVLIDHSLLQGSIKDGVTQHDLLRSYAIAQMPPKELVQMQGSILRTLGAQLEKPQTGAQADASSVAQAKHLTLYSRTHLGHHANGAIEESAYGGSAVPPLSADHEVVELAISHGVEWVRTQIGAGIGAGRLRVVAHEAAGAKRWLRVGQLWALNSGVDDEDNQGSCRMEAWQALQRVEPVSEASVALEADMIRGLVLKRGGLKINSDEYNAANARLDELMRTPVGQASDAVQTVRKITQGMFDYARLHAMSSVREGRGFLKAYEQLVPKSGLISALTKLGASSFAARAGAALNSLTLSAALLHSTACQGYEWESDYGEDGAWLRQLSCAWYQHAEHHDTLKKSTGRDVLLSGLGGWLLLLRFGDAHSALAASTAAITDWEKVLSNIQAGKAVWRTYRIDLLDQRAARAMAMAIGRHADALQLFESSPEGVLFAKLRRGDRVRGTTTSAITLPSGSNAQLKTGESPGIAAETEALEGHVQAVNEYMGHWGMQCTWTASSFALMAQAVGTLLLPAAEWQATATASTAPSSFDWLPPPEDLILLAEAERAWDVYMVGAQHPALACGLVYARLGMWSQARTLSDGLLRLLKQPVTRFEAACLRARCAAADGESAADVTTWMRAAVDEAAAAGYLFLELIAKRELEAREGAPSTLDALAETTKSAGEGLGAMDAAAAAAFLEDCMPRMPECIAGTGAGTGAGTVQ